MSRPYNRKLQSLAFVVAALPALLAICCATPCDAANTIYDALTGPGVKISGQDTLQLPKPALPDGLTPQQTRQTIETLLAGKYDWETFTRKAVVSPFLLKISEGTAESGPIVRKIDLYFITYGSLDSLKGEDYLNKQLTLTGSNEQSDSTGQVHLLKTDELQKRNI